MIPTTAGRPPWKRLGVPIPRLWYSVHIALAYAYQVLGDWETVLPKPLQKLSTEDSLLCKAGQELLLKVSLQLQLDHQEAALLARYQAKFSGWHKQRRRSNRDFLEKLDNMLRQCLGWGINAYVLKHPSRPIREGERRYLARVRVPGCSEGEGKFEFRASFEEADGTRRFEVPRVVSGGQRVYPIAHLCSDQGSLGLAGALWLRQGLQARVTLTWDLLHRLQNDLLAAQASSGMLITKMEYLQCTKLRAGPWNRQAHFWSMKSAAGEFFSQFSPSRFLFSVLFDELAMEAGMHHASDYVWLC